LPRSQLPVPSLFTWHAPPGTAPSPAPHRLASPPSGWRLFFCYGSLPLAAVSCFLLIFFCTPDCTLFSKGPRPRPRGCPSPSPCPSFVMQFPFSLPVLVFSSLYFSPFTPSPWDCPNILVFWRESRFLAPLDLGSTNQGPGITLWPLTLPNKKQCSCPNPYSQFLPSHKTSLQVFSLFCYVLPPRWISSLPQNDLFSILHAATGILWWNFQTGRDFLNFFPFDSSLQKAFPSQKRTLLGSKFLTCPVCF